MLTNLSATVSSLRTNLMTYYEQQLLELMKEAESVKTKEERARVLEKVRILEALSDNTSQLG